MSKVFGGSLSLAWLVPSVLLADLEAIDLKSSVYTEIGQIVSGTQGGNQDLSKDFIHRLGANITGTKGIDERLFLNVGVGGVIWQPFPVDRKQFYRNNIRTNFDIDEVSAQYNFTENLRFKGGYIKYKYNQYASNLGEYLFRSEAYPAILRTDEWSLIGAAATRNFGLQLEWDFLNGLIQQDILLLMENEIPQGDFSPAYVLALEPVKGLTLSGGISLHHWLALPQNNLAPENARNTYVSIENFPEVQNIAEVAFMNTSGVLDTAFVTWRGGASLPDASQIPGAASISRIVESYQTGSIAGTRSGILFQVGNMRNCVGTESRIGQCQGVYIDTSTISLSVVDTATGVVVPDTNTSLVGNVHHYTFKAVKLMGHFALDIGKMMDLDIGPFAVFGEIAVLGLEEQPLYYEDVGNRMPMTLGIHIPTFGLLDLLTFQIEKFKNPYSQSATRIFQFQSPIPFVDPSSDEPVSKDDLKWSAVLNKTIFNSLGIRVKVASDYLRLRNDDFEQLINTETLLNKPSEWYYVTQLYWGF